MKKLSNTQVKSVSGGFLNFIWPAAVIIGGLVIDGFRHRHDKDLAKREGMDPINK